MLLVACTEAACFTVILSVLRVCAFCQFSGLRVTMADHAPPAADAEPETKRHAAGEGVLQPEEQEQKQADALRAAAAETQREAAPAVRESQAESFPSLASLLAPLAGATEEEMEGRLSSVVDLADQLALLAAVNTEKGAAGLSWVQLEKCDGLHLVDKTSCLGLTVWTQKERERRQALTNAAGAANKAARAALSEDEEAGEAWLTNADGEPLACKLLDQELGDALERGDLDAAKKAFANGADPSLYDAFEAPDDGFPDDKEIPEDITWLTKHDLEALCAEEDEDDEKDEDDKETNEKEILEVGYDGDDYVGAQPLICKVANNLTICNWLMDVGVDVNSRQPTFKHGEDQGEFGGMNALVLANTIEAVELLCARGADANCTYTLPRFPETYDRCTARGIVAADTSDGAIARCLVRHGANVNVIFAPDEAQEKGDTGGVKISLNEASICSGELTFGSKLEFGSYWKTVVASGDVLWAADLLRTYGANANWPVRKPEESEEAELHEHATDYYSRIVEQELGCDDDFSTVLMIAARMENLPMVRLLLEHGADVNEARPDFAAVDAGGRWQRQMAETPLSVALGTGNAHVIELLKSKGANE